MVRLKDGNRVQAEAGDYISIPYGAIKSAPAVQVPSEEAHFNSIWCD